jgi:predicted DNA-binding protein YlxM (UPF0122 family)
MPITRPSSPHRPAAHLRGYLRKCRKRRRRQVQYEQLIAYYADGHSLRACAEFFGISFQRVHQIIQSKAPQLMRVRDWRATRRQYKVRA